ncbi:MULTISPECIES: DUF4160 domain-containing protein [unclassified Imperialibacter]|uniref:DUF4160 domain-containing protein n=1 Tax=unclassified Imperialibacter TaxID=2629706 RepID=UPI001256B3F3|nr:MULTISPECIES: DUF4160 domain-containing protein [unclassified Imperialibacter]CAD5253967.1 conserved hypothetical protein [Imperialibacter sp. 75]CAD5262343.1 conserved hypothetical protein [Imperialibacter sp. 89]VVT35237.1 conserved hypothetical protein [Imperialibacter sp. EC-SDR9]
MPKILDQDGFKFFFYSGDGDELCHVHISKGKADGKIWLEPEINEEYLEGFKAQERAQIKKIVSTNRDNFIRKWYEYFSNK